MIPHKKKRRRSCPSEFLKAFPFEYRTVASFARTVASLIRTMASVARIVPSLIRTVASLARIVPKFTYGVFA